MAVGAVVGGASQKPREQRRLGERELFRRFPEPRARGGLHPARIAAEGHAVEVALKYFVFVHEKFQRRSLGEFNGLCPGGTRAVYGEAHDLACYRGGARDDASAGEILPRGARDRDGVDAAVKVETAVFQRYGRRRHPAPHVRQGDRQPPFPRRGKSAAQGASLPVRHDERGRAVQYRAEREGDDERRLREKQEQQDDEGRPMRQPPFAEASPCRRKRIAHGGGKISI